MGSCSRAPAWEADITSAAWSCRNTEGSTRCRRGATNRVPTSAPRCPRRCAQAVNARAAAARRDSDARPAPAANCAANQARIAARSSPTPSNWPARNTS
ncbi:hypothetical protein Acsp05_51010 [Actinokineospora sp. NBRC 105648]|nr:hypothetical protein Acsp05_51010 [Actinokineospora sp. NBRC 105648]